MRKHRARDALISLVAAAALGSSSLAAFNTSVPAGSGIIAIGGHPEPQNNPKPLIEHVPLGNLLNFEVDFVNQGASALTFTEGKVQFYDENHNPILGLKSFDAMTFDEDAVRVAGPNPKGSGANVPAGERIILLFPFEELPHNVVPATVDVRLFFAEFADPVAFLDIALTEYHAPPGQTYSYPTMTPALPAGEWFSGGGHELATTGHRRGGLRRGSGNTVWVNQRYAYDIDVHVGNANCDDGNGGSGTACNQDQHYFCWAEPIHAIGDGEVVLIIKDNADNPEPLCAARMDCSQCTSYDGGANMDQPVPSLCAFSPGAGGCNNQPDAGLCSAMTDPCAPGAFPGSGNQIVLLHPNGEFSTYAHMMMGSNNHLFCGDQVDRGDVIGMMGMTGTGSNPHMHFSTLSTPGPEAFISENFPIYFNNIRFATPGIPTTPKLQLDVSLPSGTLITEVLPPPSPLPANPASPPGDVNEVEPDDELSQHQTLTPPTTVHGTLGFTDDGAIAVRGDGIEDIYRVNIPALATLDVTLSGFGFGQNLDLYLADEQLRVLNPVRQGSAASGDEHISILLKKGAYYLFVSNVDSTKFFTTDYLLRIGRQLEPVITIPGPVTFPDTCVGAVRTATLSVCNTGKGDLEVDPITSSNPRFAVTVPTSGYPVVISPDFCFPFRVTFTPAGPGAQAATLTVPSNDPVNPSVEVQANGRGIEQNLATVMADNGSFGDVCRESFKDLTLAISNSGGCDLTVTGIASSSPVEFAVPAVMAFPLVIGPVDSLQVPIRFAPTILGMRNATITISSDDPDTPSKQVAVSGNAPPGDVRVTGSTDLGAVCASTPAEKTLSVCNVGACNLAVTSVGFDPPCADFTLVNNPFPATVSPDSCRQVVIRFTPTSAGPKVCTVVITTDDPDTPVLVKEVTANTPVPMIDMPPDQGFPPTVIQSVGACSSAGQFPVSNTGSCNLTITGFAITDNGDEFSLAGLPSFPIILEPGHVAGEGDLTMVFAPDVLDRDRVGQLTVTYLSDPITKSMTSVTRALCGEAVRTGARVLVTAGGVPLAMVEQIKIGRINANRNKNLVDTVETARNLPVQNVILGTPCAPFQYHREYGTVSNPIQLLPGSYQVTATAIVNGKRKHKTVGFDVSTCGFNPTVMINF